MMENPWMVEKLQDFLFLNCPECSFKTKAKDYFQNHAVKEHPMSCAFFNDFEIETEQLDFDCIGTNQTLEEIMFPDLENIAPEALIKPKKKSDDIKTIISMDKENKTIEPRLHHLCQFCDYETTNEFQFRSHIKAHPSVLPIAVLTRKLSDPNKKQNDKWNGDISIENPMEICKNELVKCIIANCKFESKPAYMKNHMKSK